MISKSAPFKLTKRQVLIDRLVYDPKVIEEIHSYAKRHNMPLEVVQKNVRLYAREIVPSFNAYFYFRVGYWIAKKIARLLYRVRVGLLRDEEYRSIDPDSTVVFVMNHRSNMDYILVAFLAAERTTLSYAVGEWAKIWPLHMLFRFMGAFFVRRNSGDALYRRVLERYIHMATEQGVCQAVFLEGGLSRDGAMQKPKLGLVDYMLRRFDPAEDRDIVFIPVGINYDRTIEDRSLLRALDPTLEKRSMWFVIRTTGIFVARSIMLMMLSRWRRYGYACVNFGTPFSVKAYCRETGIVFSRIPRADRFPEIEKLCERLMAAIEEVVPVLPVALVSTVFLESMESGLGHPGCGETQQSTRPRHAATRGAHPGDVSQHPRARDCRCSGPHAGAGNHYDTQRSLLAGSFAGADSSLLCELDPTLGAQHR